MTALLFNIRINEREKLDLFKVTLKEIATCFEECYFKVRGQLSEECVNYTKLLFDCKKIKEFQSLPEDDWVKTTLRMIDTVESRSVYLYFEDHRLIPKPMKLKQILTDFEKNKLDYLCYSWFIANKLNHNNILPLNPRKGRNLDMFQVSKENIKLIGKISEKYYTFSLMSICSVEYLRSNLIEENKVWKFHSNILNAIIFKFFGYPLNRKIYFHLNKFFGLLNFRICLYPPNSPFNLEKMWSETPFLQSKLKFGLLKDELLANYDDDNGAYGESLVKRGLYPLKPTVNAKIEEPVVTLDLKLKKKECRDLTYFSQTERISFPPYLKIIVTKGSVELTYGRSKKVLKADEASLVYSNLKPLICAKEGSIVRVEIFDKYLS